MNRLKGIQVTRLADMSVEVIPLYHARRGATVKARGMRQVGQSVGECMEKLLPVLLGRQDLQE